MELKKKECYHKNVQKITRTAGTSPRHAGSATGAGCDYFLYTIRRN